MARGLQDPRPIVVLDACVLVPPALRDLLLSCAHVGLFRPVWQDEILDEVRRNSARLLIERKYLQPEAASAVVLRTLDQMARAFPAAFCEGKFWVPLVANMQCDRKDRHVLAVAVGSGATHLLTENTRDFPLKTRPSGLEIVKPDQFMLDQLAAAPEQVVGVVEDMSRRLKNPRQTPSELAKLMSGGVHLPGFGAALSSLLG